jgi:hypothetical protein
VEAARLWQHLAAATTTEQLAAARTVMRQHLGGLRSRVGGAQVRRKGRG